MNEKYNYNNTIYKSNELIEACYNLTTTQNRILYLAMTKLETRILDKNLNIKTVEDAIYRSNFELINIPVSLYKNVFNIKSGSIYEHLTKTAEELYNSEIIYFDNDGNIVKKRWVITCVYDKNEKGIKLQFHPDLIKDLLVLKSQYTKLIFDEFVDKISKKNSFRVYELCKQYVKYGFRDFYVDDFRFKLALNDDEYPRYYDLKKYVIEQSIKEINNGTDIKLTYEPLEYVKRNVIKFRIWIQKVNQKQLDFFDKKSNEVVNDDEKLLVKKISEIIQFNIKPGEAKNILTVALTAIDTIPELKNSNIGVVDYIKEKLPLVLNYLKSKQQKNEPCNFIGALLSSLKFNWKPTQIEHQSNNAFNNFTQRNNSDEYYDDLEKKLLGWE